MFNIRPYKNSDYEAICSWWKAADELPPTLDMLPLETTFIMEIDGQAALCLAVYFTNTKELCYLSSFCGNPEFKGEKRKEAAQKLMDAVCGFAGAFGYKNVLCFAYKDKVKKRYEEMGFTPTLSNMTGFCRKVG